MSTTVKDAIERVGATVVVTALGALTVWLGAGAPMTREAALLAAMAVCVPLYDVVKVVLASRLKSTTGASLVKLD